MTERTNTDLTVTFHPVTHGMIPFDIALHGPVACERFPCDPQVEIADELPEKTGVLVRARVADSSCGFPLIIAWLEAVTCGVQECACYWDGEGPDGELRWGGAWESGSLRVGWTSEDFVYRIFIDKAKVVRAFYRSFRAFVESDQYDPLAYEELSIGEVLALVLEGGDVAALANALASCSRGEAEALLEVMWGLASDRDAGYPRRKTLAQFREGTGRYEPEREDEERWIIAEWDAWNASERQRYVVDRVYACDAALGFGSKLRELRSPLVEKWLMEHPDSERQSRDAAS